MATKRSLRKSSVVNPSSSAESLLEVAVAAISPSNDQEKVNEFINFIITSLKRNADWLNSFVHKHSTFKCRMLVGAGADCFQLKNEIYPVSEGNPPKFEIELKDSVEYDQIGVAGIAEITKLEFDSLLDYIRSGLGESSVLKEDILRGQAMGISFVVLKPFLDKQLRVIEKIVDDCSITVVTKRKRKKIEPFIQTLMKVRRII